MVSPDGFKPRKVSQSLCQAPTFGCLLVGAYLRVATSTPPPASAWPGEMPGSRPSPTTAHGRHEPKRSSSRPPLTSHPRRASSGKSGRITRVRLWPIAGTHERPVRSSSVAICIGPNPVPIGQNLQNGSSRRASRGTAPHADYEVIDSTLPVDTHAMHVCGEVEDASRQRQTSARLLQLVQGSVLQVLGKQRIVDSGRSAAGLGQ